MRSAVTRLITGAVQLASLNLLFLLHQRLSESRCRNPKIVEATFVGKLHTEDYRCRGTHPPN